MSSKLFAVVSGARAGIGRAAALRFAKTYPVAIVAPGPESYQDTLTEINQAGGKAVGVTADVTDSCSIDLAFQYIQMKLPGLKLAAAVYNAPFSHTLKPFLELNSIDLQNSLTNNVKGIFQFAQKTIPLLLEAVPESEYPPTLIITGATSSIRGTATNAALAAGMFGRRALAQSLAREFHPRGVHVAHTIFDGTIDKSVMKELPINGSVEDDKLNPEAIAEAYWYLHSQPRSTFTHELDLRPYVQRF
ncbi:NAD(P)-binding protein [Xylaria sp. FL0043]|nr:NAD(P)-binding protein [Xylaria sp. FL0043]